MRKSNSKETRRAVEAYVLQTIEDYTDADEPETMRPVSRYFDRLKDEMSFQSYRSGDRVIIGAGLAKEYRKAGRYSGYVAATNPYWVWYLAVFNGNFEAYTGDVFDNLQTWLDETNEEAERYNSDQAWSMYAHMSASAFNRLYNRETEPHRVPVSEFARLLAEHCPESTMFDRDTMRYYHQTQKDITVEAFYLVEDYKGNTRDCYRVESRQMTDYDERRRTLVYYFDRESFDLVKFVDPEK